MARRRKARDRHVGWGFGSYGDGGGSSAHVTRQQIYTWRSELKKKGLLSPSTNAVFIPVDMSAVQTEPHGDQHDRSGMIELRLPRGRSLCFDSGVNASVLTRLIRAVEAA